MRGWRQKSRQHICKSENARGLQQPVKRGKAREEILPLSPEGKNLTDTLISEFRPLGQFLLFLATQDTVICHCSPGELVHFIYNSWTRL